MMQNIFSSLLLYIYSKYNSNMECAKIIKGKTLNQNILMDNSKTTGAIFIYLDLDFWM